MTPRQPAVGEDDIAEAADASANYRWAWRAEPYWHRLGVRADRGLVRGPRRVVEVKRARSLEGTKDAQTVEAQVG